MLSKDDETLQSDLIRVAHLLADAARIETLRVFRSPSLLTDDKSSSPSDFDPVTQADRAAEKAMRDILARERPDDSILGEEFATKQGTTGLTWVLDPIDGTRGFVAGTPTWGVLIAVSDLSGPLFGIIDQPYIGERFIGGFGQSQMTGPHGAAQLQVRKTGALKDALLLSTFPEVGTVDEAKAFHAVARDVKLTRYGMDCYGYALLAAGHVDLVIEAGLQPYDIHAPIAVIQAAGGVVTNWDGGPAHTGGRILAAASRELHTQALTILQENIGG
jgi:histidinol phosphatase-like enzyme (inositol monophosphatase family)